ncbi:MAG TPA: hypothetical protein VMU37_10850 [Caulobacteraceae bacterium]|nr:hypothetical protein [Caulobacteraceae bacterium]
MSACRSSLLRFFVALGFAALLTAFAGPGVAQTDNDLHGRLEIQDAGQFSGPDSIEAAFGEQTADDALANLRLTWQPTWGAWSLQAHYVVAVDDGPDVTLARAESGLIAIPPPTMFDLTDNFVDHGRVLASQTIDRLAVAYTTPDWVVRIGRQAITWGSGLVFRPMDLFDPFSPSATDTEYKPGVDMVYVQRLFADGSDLQLIAAPRPDHFGGAPTANASSFALHYADTLFGHPMTWLLARDHGDWVAGLGVNGALSGATWNVELVPTFERDGRTRVSGLANISDAVTLAGDNATVFAEYFHNGFGVAGGPFDLADLPADLTDRLARGQLFNLRQDYLAAGMTLEATPLLNLSPTLIADLDDGSLFLLFAGTYSLGDNLTLIGGVQAPVGRRGSEFGGLPLSAADPTLLAPPAEVYLQLRRYF